MELEMEMHEIHFPAFKDIPFLNFIPKIIFLI